MARARSQAKSNAVQVASSGALRVLRRATDHGHGGGARTRLLSDWRELDAYVLLGDPGAGKTCSFEAEATACGVTPIPARDIVDRVAPAPKPGQSVFIDGLDEVRAGAGDGKTLLGAIREWLHAAGRPRFRLSCREADWLGDSDRSALARVAPGQQVTVLHLEPLQEDDVLALLRDRPSDVPDPRGFWQQAKRLGLTGLFGNPLLLGLTIKAVAAAGEWPATRLAIYEAACRQLAAEHSTEHKAVKRPPAGAVDRVLDDAGLLCALLMLSNRAGFDLQGKGAPGAIELASLPAALPVLDARAALASKVFTSVAGCAVPRHRSIAEFLAAKALAKRLALGLPLGRVLALMQGFDGQPVEPLRGLFGWLAVHHAADRGRLMALDPLGIVLNGDVAALAKSERLDLLHALGDTARRDPWFRREAWVSRPFGPLAAADMAQELEAQLGAPERDDAHLAFIDCVFDALRHGGRLTTLVPALEAWVVDATASSGLRLKAYAAWKHNAAAKGQPAQQKAWLEQALQGTISDSDDRLSGALLHDLYPLNLGPREVFKYLHPPRRGDVYAEYSRFWYDGLLEQARAQDYAVLADAWLKLSPTDDDFRQDFEWRDLAGKVLVAALHRSGARVSNERLYAWLGIGVDRHGLSALNGDASKEVAQWLHMRPLRIKALVALGFGLVQTDAQGQRFYWEALQRLHGAGLPPDWLRWLLELAASSPDDALAEYCLRSVAGAVVAPPTGFDVPSMEELEAWVEAQACHRPAARDWLAQAWTSPLEDWRGDQHRRSLRHKAQQQQTRDERKRALGAHWADMASTTAPADLLHQVALAHEKRFSNIAGDTPLARVQDFLVSDVATAQAALIGLDKVLERDDLPSVDDILKTAAKGKYHLIRPAALVAAARSAEHSPGAALAWPEALARKLVAFHLTEGIGEVPAWYKQLAARRPALVAPILVRYALQAFKRRDAHVITGLGSLSHESEQRELARLVLPALLDAFPKRASETHRRMLNRSLLATLSTLPDAQAKRVIRSKLAQPGLDATQRISWSVAELPYRAKAAEDLAAWVGNNERRAVALGIALHEQGSLARTTQRLSPAALRHLIEVLAPITPRDTSLPPGIVSAADEREDTLRGLLNSLSTDPSPAARDALQALADSPRMGAWHSALAYAMRAQQHAAREAQFQAASPADVALVIANLAPANAADLLALLVAHVEDLGADLTRANTYLVRQFWQLNKTPAVPQIENDCRDLLLEKLKARLRGLHIYIEREASAAHDKRADMAAVFMRSSGPLRVPVEIKKEDNDTLWTAWRDQLQRLYTNDPAAGGYGLYLVLWFGHKPRATEGVKPRNTAHLRALIEARIPEAQRHQLLVRVLDLSLPV